MYTDDDEYTARQGSRVKQYGAEGYAKVSWNEVSPDTIKAPLDKGLRLNGFVER